VLEPKYFPVDANPASLMIIAARQQGLDALRLTQRILRAVWVEEVNIADTDTIIGLADELEMDGKALVEASGGPDIATQYEHDTQHAIQRGVFGVPTYAIDDELFWGQDRLDFIKRKLE
jgi:2-hydroxychromene-2-carboxylate isomerase